jgi:hypothetical protein
MITRGFSFDGNVETAFEAVARAGGLDKTKELVCRHCKEAVTGLDESVVNTSDIAQSAGKEELSNTNCFVQGLHLHSVNQQLHFPALMWGSGM